MSERWDALKRDAERCLSLPDHVTSDNRSIMFTTPETVLELLAARDEAQREAERLKRGFDECERTLDEKAALLVEAQRERDNLRQAYELKIQDFQKETLRSSALKKAFDREHEALTELWKIKDALQARVRVLEEALREIARGPKGDWGDVVGIARAALAAVPTPVETPNAAEAPCTRCGATPKTGLTEGCSECEGVTGPVETPGKCYCGYLDWTVEKYGRTTHKHLCPARVESFCQTHPKGCPVETAEERK